MSEDKATKTLVLVAFIFNIIYKQETSTHIHSYMKVQLIKIKDLKCRF